MPRLGAIADENWLVAKGYRPVNRDQQFLMPASMREWLAPDDPVWLVISAVEGFDTSGLHAKRRVGGAGRAGYDPDMLLTLLIWAWAQGVRSSRVIERLCQRDVAFRIICAGDAPDHVTVSRFRAQAADICEDLFAQVLRLCAGLEMGRLGVVAIDSVKIASNASLAANRTEDGLVKAAAQQAEIDARQAREIAAGAAAEHAATDAAEDELYGPGRRGDELPAELVDPASRAARIAQAIEELKAANKTAGASREAAEQRQRDREEKQQQHDQVLLDKYRAQQQQGRAVTTGRLPAESRVQLLEGNLVIHRARAQAQIDAFWARPFRGGHIPGPVEANTWVRRAQAALDRAIADLAAEQQAAQQQAAQQGEQGHHAAGPSREREPRRNITDPQSRMMPLRGGGWLQGYNCQAATSSDGLIIATSVSNNASDATAFATIMDKTVAAAGLMDTHRPRPAEASAEIGTVLADAGYLSNANLTAPGPDRLIAVGKSRDLAMAARQEPATGPPPPDVTPIEAMAHRLRTPEGHNLYKQRSHIAETPFAHAKHNLGFSRFTSRGINRAAAEFTFHALVHNLFKVIRAGVIAPATG